MTARNIRKSPERTVQLRIFYFSETCQTCQNYLMRPYLTILLRIWHPIYYGPRLEPPTFARFKPYLSLARPPPRTASVWLGLYSLSMLPGRIIKNIFNTKARNMPTSPILYLTNSSGCAHDIIGLAHVDVEPFLCLQNCTLPLSTFTLSRTIRKTDKVCTTKARF